MDQWLIDHIVEMMHYKAIGEFKQWISDEEKSGDVYKEEKLEVLENIIIIIEFRNRMEESF